MTMILSTILFWLQDFTNSQRFFWIWCCSHNPCDLQWWFNKLCVMQSIHDPLCDSIFLRSKSEWLHLKEIGIFSWNIKTLNTMAPYPHHKLGLTCHLCISHVTLLSSHIHWLSYTKCISPHGQTQVMVRFSIVYDNVLICDNVEGNGSDFPMLYHHMDKAFKVMLNVLPCSISKWTCNEIM